MDEEIKEKRILVADSDQNQINAIVATLKAAGITNLEVARNGTDAWQSWKKDKKIDIIIASWSLSEMSGLDFLKRIRADQLAPVQPAFIVMTDIGGEKNVEVCVSEGADAVIQKPFDGQGMLDNLREGVGYRKQMGNKTIPDSTRVKKQSIMDSLLSSMITGELIFERYTTSVDCDELHHERCIIRVVNNYGLGTMLNIRFARQGANTEGFYKPIKGLVTKVERVPKEVGIYRLHVQFSKRPSPEQGVHDLMTTSSADITP